MQKIMKQISPISFYTNCDKYLKKGWKTVSENIKNIV